MGRHRARGRRPRCNGCRGAGCRPIFQDGSEATLHQRCQPSAAAAVSIPMLVLGSAAAALTGGSLHFSMLVALLIPVLLVSLASMMRTVARRVPECISNDSPAVHERTDTAVLCTDSFVCALRRCVCALKQLGIALLVLPIAIVLDAISLLLRCVLAHSER